MPLNSPYTLALINHEMEAEYRREILSKPLDKRDKAYVRSRYF